MRSTQLQIFYKVSLPKLNTGLDFRNTWTNSSAPPLSGVWFWDLKYLLLFLLKWGVYWTQFQQQNNILWLAFVDVCWETNDYDTDFSQN